MTRTASVHERFSEGRVRRLLLSSEKQRFQTKRILNQKEVTARCVIQKTTENKKKSSKKKKKNNATYMLVMIFFSFFSEILKRKERKLEISKYFK